MADEEVEHTYLFKKIESIESRLESHVTKIEQRLDQLVNIMGAVATLQERETRNADSIREIKGSIKDSFDKFERAIERIHDRLDTINKNMDSNILAVSESKNILETEIKRVDSEVSKWKDRGVGLWLGISALIICLQILGGYILQSTVEDYKQTKARVEEINKKEIELENTLGKINATLLVIQNQTQYRGN
jgi:DNA repair exonuclease SbcCD ATPase subunit